MGNQPVRGVVDRPPAAATTTAPSTSQSSNESGHGDRKRFSSARLRVPFIRTLLLVSRVKLYSSRSVRKNGAGVADFRLQLANCTEPNPSTCLNGT
mmetsp:Transcript_1456/g.3606  ORF Transcript_1456/g.3606 Transcript_1456/m.3606 type:complete len:96 (-) Transcript_1456:102-389(-)